MAVPDEPLLSGSLRVQQLRDLTPPAPANQGALHGQGVYRLSAYVSLRPIPGQGFLLESLLSGHTLAVRTPTALRLLLALSSPTALDRLLEGVREEARPTLLRFLEQCWEDKLLVEVGNGPAEDEGSLAHWEFHDLLFHVRSRRGRNHMPLGATYHLQGRVPPEPALRPHGDEGRVVHLAPPDEAEPAAELSLREALQRRRSLYSTHPVSLDTLGRFLHRTCRVTALSGAPGEELARKPYPSGGSLHSLEVYVLPWDCPGLEGGVFRYRGTDHALVHVCGPSPEVEELLSEAQRGTGGLLPSRPPILLVVTARFRRVALKYQSIAYRLILEETGALYQTMYLVATSLGLAPCAIGAGDSDRFARVIGSDYYQETSVGEFILGGAPGAAA